MRRTFMDRAGNTYRVDVKWRKNSRCYVIYLDGEFYATAETIREVNDEIADIVQKFDIAELLKKEVIRN